MKHFRLLLPLLVLVLMLSACGSTSGEPYDVSLDGNRVVTIHPDAGTIRYGRDVYRYKMKNVWGNTCCELTYPDGRRCTWTESLETGEGSWSEEETPSIYLDRDLLVRALKQPAPEDHRPPREKKGHPVLGVFCCLGGIVLIVFHKWRGEPSGRRRFVAFGKNAQYGVEVSPEEYAGITFVEGALLLIFGLCQFIF